MNSGRRKTIRIHYTEVPPKLKELVLKVPKDSSFHKIHGYLLSLVNTEFDEGLMSVLFQFFEPKHHCFTFPDYQLVPTLEEFSKLLGLPILERVPFTGLEQDPASENVVVALHLKPSDIESYWKKKRS